MRWIVYETRNLVNGKIYRGKHGQEDEGFDGYFGSGELLILAIKKYGVENFERRTLREFATEAEALAYEAEIVTEEFCKRPDTYNLMPGGRGGAQTDPEVLERIADALKGREFSVEHRANISESLKGEKNPQYGKERSAETRANISESLKGRELSAEHRAKMSEARKGRELSAEHRASISESLKGEKNPNYGKKHSAETLAKIAEGVRRAWERRRAS